MQWDLCDSRYPLATPAKAAGAKAASIFKTGKFSDHAPITIEYDWVL